MAGYKSVVFDPSAMQTELTSVLSIATEATYTASAATVKATAASSGVSDASSKATAASVAASQVTATASDAASQASVALALASDASSKANELQAGMSSVVKSKPYVGSFAVKDLIYTSDSFLKVRISSIAVP